MIHLFHSKLRLRLTVLYVFLLSIVLVVYAAWSLTVLLHDLMRQTDSRLDREIDAVEHLIRFSSDGTVSVDSDTQTAYSFEIWSENGILLYRSIQLHGQMLGPAPENGNPLLPTERSIIRLSDGTHRVATRVLQLGSRSVLIRLCASTDLTWRRFREVAIRDVLGVPVALVIIGISGYFVARRALRPLELMAARAEKISAERLNERLEIVNPYDEIGQLAGAFNETLSRLERSFEQLKRFTADASHELRTPLTAMRSVGEVALERSGDTNYYRDVIGSMLEEVNRLTHLVNTLLVLSMADAGKLSLQRTELPLLELAIEAAALLEVLAEEKDQAVHVNGDSSITILGDRLILRQALLAIIHNAIKYSPVRGEVNIWVAANNGDALIEVRDNGPGIPVVDRNKVFERFYRVDKARTADHEGVGLGLSIAEWAVGAHGGGIEVECGPARGCTFRIRLPISSG